MSLPSQASNDLALHLEHQTNMQRPWASGRLGPAFGPRERATDNLSPTAHLLTPVPTYLTLDGSFSTWGSGVARPELTGAWELD